MHWLVPALALIVLAPEFEEIVWPGQVVTLAEALGDFEVAFDAAPIQHQVAFVAEDGRIVPLLSDPASRALFDDERLRNRPIEIRGRSYTTLPYLLVTSFRVLDGGKWRTPEYYCDICTISVRYPQECPCCQGSMELRMRPDTP